MSLLNDLILTLNFPYIQLVIHNSIIPIARNPIISMLCKLIALYYNPYINIYTVINLAHISTSSITNPAFNICVVDGIKCDKFFIINVAAEDSIAIFDKIAKVNPIKYLKRFSF